MTLFELTVLPLTHYVHIIQQHDELVWMADATLPSGGKKQSLHVTGN